VAGSGVARNFNGGLVSLPLTSLPLTSLSYFVPSLSALPLLPFPSLPVPSSFLLPLLLEVRPSKIQLGGLGERCELPQQGLGQSPSQNRIWCILALKR